MLPLNYTFSSINCYQKLAETFSLKDKNRFPDWGEKLRTISLVLGHFPYGEIRIIYFRDVAFAPNYHSVVEPINLIQTFLYK